MVGPSRVCSARAGLYLNIGQSCRQTFPAAEIGIVCGRDAAARTLHWPYQDPQSLPALFSLARLWVFARGGQFSPPAQWLHAIQLVDFDNALQTSSASEVRSRVQSGEPWYGLVPESIHALVEHIYRSPLPAIASADPPPDR